MIELLVVLAIIGALAAIAIPQYASYKASGNDSKAKADLHNMATAMEAYYSSAVSYAGTDLTALKIFGFRQSANVDDVIVTANQTAYSLTANPTGGSGTWSFDSIVGLITGEANPVGAFPVSRPGVAIRAESIFAAGARRSLAAVTLTEKRAILHSCRAATPFFRTTTSCWRSGSRNCGARSRR